MRIRAWWFFAAVAAASLVGLVRLLVVSDATDPNAREQILTAALFVLVFGVIATGGARSEQRARAADRSGPALPAGADAPTDVSGRAGADRWTLDQVAARLARDLGPMNGVVFREGRSRRLRIMLDPASAIQEVRWKRRPGDTSRLRSPSIRGQWWEVIWRAGRAPRIKARTSEVGVRIAPGGRLVPRWLRPAGSNASERARSMAALLSAQGGDTDLEISGHELVRVVDDVAVRSGWASRGQVAAAPRDQALGHGRRVVSRRAAPATGTAARPIGAVVPPGSLHPPGASVPGSSWARSARVVRLVGIGILAACVLATVIGLLAGMVWWASFIIVGSGLVFCAIFVLPVLLIARAESGRSR